MPMLRPVPKLQIEIDVIVETWALAALWADMGNRLRKCGWCPACVGEMLHALEISRGAKGKTQARA
jgi:hypothetical protein